MNVILIESREDRLLLSISNLFPRLHADTYREHVEKHGRKEERFRVYFSSLEITRILWNSPLPSSRIR